MIRIDDPGTWPAVVVASLRQPTVADIFNRAEFYSEVSDLQVVRDAGTRLVEACHREGLAGFHCSREPQPGHFKEHGLETTNPSRMIERFLHDQDWRFRPETLARVRQKVERWMANREQMDCRTGQVRFCLAGELVDCPGAENLFDYFGGDVVYAPFLDSREEEVLRILGTIGSPVVVEACLDLSTFQFWGEQVLARGFLSYFGRLVNPSFNFEPSEGYSRIPVPGNRIVRVWPRDEFLAHLPRNTGHAATEGA